MRTRRGSSRSAKRQSEWQWCRPNARRKCISWTEPRHCCTDPTLARMSLIAYNAPEECGMPRIERVAVIGLDCAEPTLTFGPWLAHMPNLRRLCETGTFGTLNSCLPPITVPAWSCMASSKDPGQLGIYGFRNRRDWSYDGLDIALSTAVKESRVWDLLTEAGRSSIVV